MSSTVRSSTLSSSSSASSSTLISSADSDRSARDEVAQLFQRPDQLVRIGPYLADCTARRMFVESQLSAAVRTQVDETRLGLQMIEEAAGKMHKMRDNFMQIDKYCKECKLVLRDSPSIDRVNLARKNLDATTRLLAKFRSLPAQAEAIIDELDASDRAIKGAYKSLRKLFHLRDSAMEQPMGGLNNVMARPNAGGGGGGGVDTNDFLAQLRDNFAELPIAAASLEERLWSNISDCVFLSKEDPIALVRSMEVIEMEDRAMRKMFGREKEEASSSSKLATKSTPATPTSTSLPSKPSFTTRPQAVVSMRDKCLTVIETSIADQFSNLHRDEQQNAEDEASEKKDTEMKRKAKVAADLAKKKKQAADERARRRREDENYSEDDSAHPSDDDNGDDPRSNGPNATGGLFHKPDEAMEAEMKQAAAESSGGPSAGELYITAILEQLNEIVSDFLPSMTSLVPCFPPDYYLPSFYIERYLRWIKLTLQFHTNDPSKLSKVSMLRMVVWIEWYGRQLKSWEVAFPSWRYETAPMIAVANDMVAFERLQRDAQRKALQDSLDLDNIIHELMTTYTSSTETTLKLLVDNILRAEEKAEPELDSEGHYSTAGPQDLFYTINSSIEIVLSKLGANAKPLTYVCRTLANLFTHYQRAQMDFLTSTMLEDGERLFFTGGGPQPKKIERGDTYFCAIVNNCSGCIDHMDALKELILEQLASATEAEDREMRGLLMNIESSSSSAIVPAALSPSVGGRAPPASLCDQMEDLFEECGEGFVSVASEAIELLVLTISATLQKPMAKLFTPTWLRSKDEGVTRDIVLTLEDFMGDYAKWISRDAYVSRVLIKVLHTITFEYVRILVEARLPSKSDTLFSRILEDKDEFAAFFTPYTVATEDRGVLIPPLVLKTELRTLTHIKKIIIHDPDFMSVHYGRLTTKFGGSARMILDGLLRLRLDISPNQRREMIESFVASLPPPAVAASALSHQLVQQGGAAMATSAGKNIASGAVDAIGSGVVGVRDGITGVLSTTISTTTNVTSSFWDVFKSRAPPSIKSVMTGTTDGLSTVTNVVGNKIMMPLVTNPINTLVKLGTTVVEVGEETTTMSIATFTNQANKVGSYVIPK